MNKNRCQKEEKDGVSYLEILQKFRIIVRAAQKYSQRVEKSLGVSGAQLWIMKEIERVPGLRVGEVARKLAIHQTTASNLKKKEWFAKCGCWQTSESSI